VALAPQDRDDKQKGKMNLAEIKEFLSVQSSFVGHIKHANSYNRLLVKLIGSDGFSLTKSWS